MRRDINFFSGLRASKGSDRNRFAKISLALFAGSLAIIMGMYFYLKFADNAAIKETGSESAYLSSSSVSRTQSELANETSKLDALKKYKQAAERVSSSFAALPEPNSKLLNDIAAKEPSDATVKSVSYSGGTLTLDCACADVRSPAVFVHSLEKSGKFAKVDYSGAAAGTSITGAVSYNFTVEITLKGGTYR